MAPKGVLGRRVPFTGASRVLQPRPRWPGRHPPWRWLCPPQLCSQHRSLRRWDRLSIKGDNYRRPTLIKLVDTRLQQPSENWSVGEKTRAPACDSERWSVEGENRVRALPFHTEHRARRPDPFAEGRQGRVRRDGRADHPRRTSPVKTRCRRRVTRTQRQWEHLAAGPGSSCRFRVCVCARVCAPAHRVCICNPGNSMEHRFLVSITCMNLKPMLPMHCAPAACARGPGLAGSRDARPTSGSDRRKNAGLAELQPPAW